MWHWVTEHQSVFADIAIVWLAPLVVACFAGRFLRRVLTTDPQYARVVASNSDDRQDSKAERVRPAA